MPPAVRLGSKEAMDLYWSRARELGTPAVEAHSLAGLAVFVTSAVTTGMKLRGCSEQSLMVAPSSLTSALLSVTQYT